MAISNQRYNDRARAFPSGDARCPRPSDVTSGQGLPAGGRSRLKKQVKLRLGTVNIGTLTGRHRELASILKKRRINIACVQETKWRGAKSRDIGDGFKLLYNGESTSRNGVGIVVDEKLRDNIVQVDRLSERLMAVKIDDGKAVLRVVSCYAPQSNSPDGEKTNFWTSLDTYLRSVGQEEHIVIGGDLNGHVGQQRDGYPQNHGGCGFGARNQEGTRILDCAEAHDLVVANTFFKKRVTHLITYESGGRTTQRDDWRLRRRELKLTIDTKVIPSDNFAPQHRLVVVDMRIDLGQHRLLRVTACEKIKWWRLGSCKAMFAAALGPLKMDSDQSAEGVWTNLVNTIHQAAEAALGKTKPGRRFIDKQVWFWNDDVQQAVKAKKEALTTWRTSRDDQDYQRYRTLKSAAKRAVATSVGRLHTR
uniref:Endonuclease/exonuclease/phosphatase domain-containing protein n=1 Tax=Plectus sambesii TaxID=2011161 RepID=A0A914XBY4_9BILA